MMRESFHFRLPHPAHLIGARGMHHQFGGPGAGGDAFEAGAHRVGCVQGGEMAGGGVEGRRLSLPVVVLDPGCRLPDTSCVNAVGAQVDCVN